MKWKRRWGALLMVTALIIMLLPEADAEASASDFRMDGSTLVKYVGKDKNVSVPNTVEVIGRGAFEDNTNIELVVVPNSVKRIEAYAFWGCDNLDTVVLGKGLTEVGDYTFTNCKGLVQMTIPSTVTTIGIQAFADCVNLKDISVPKETVNIHESAFDGCARLTFHCDKGSVAEEYAESFYERQKEMPEYEDVPNYDPSDVPGGANPTPAPETTSAPTASPAEEGSMLGSTQVVGNMAVVFMNNTQPHVYEEKRQESGTGDGNAPETGTLPGDGSALENGNPPWDESTSGTGTLSGDGNTSETGTLSGDGNASETGNLSGSGNASGTGTQTEGGNSSAGENSSGGESSGSGNTPGEAERPETGLTPDSAGDSLPKYTIVDGKVVADQAYYRSTELGDMALADGIREVGQFSFARSSLSSIVLPEGVETIGYGAFYHCDSLETVSLPDTVMCVEPKAFAFTPWVENFLDGDGGDGDFLTAGGVLIAYRGSAADVKIPGGVRVIAGEVFQNHTEIESVVLPDSLSVVGEGAFEGCSNLGRISFGKNLKEVKDRAFAGNTMAEVKVPASLEKVGLRAFGSAVIHYEGREAEYTHETSAARLSNEDYRIYSRTDTQAPGVTVNGPEGAFASLEGADRSYTLTVESPEDIQAMEDAFRRLFQVGLPENAAVYDLTLTDGSGIPLEKLGRQTLTVVLPVPEALRGQELKVVTLDRNGQLEAVAAERVSADGAESVRLRTNHLSLYGIYGLGAAQEGRVLLEINVDMNQLSAAPDEELTGLTLWERSKLWLGGALFLAGAVILAAGCRKRKNV